ncbi:MAG TPA: TolC family protein [Terriglobales bacterium]|nr:TolC family protein [Terriglobales bacterium]
MKPALHLFPRAALALLICSLLALFELPATAEPLSLKHAIELALAHSPAAAQAGANQQRAFASYHEARNQYIPQMLVGSGLGNSWGYPLALEGSAPSLVNITAQSPLLNPALRDFVRAARTEYQATAEDTKDRRNQVIQDTVLTYLELVKWEKLIDHLHRQYEDADKMEQIVGQRVQEGVDSVQEIKQARLATARAHLHVTQAQGAVDVLSTTLSQLTGVPVNSLHPDPDSVPMLPEIQTQPELAAKARESSPAVLSAQEHAIAQSFRARAEHRMLWPTVDFASQYAVLAKFNNWLQFFPTKAFERNNATVGVVIRFSFLNASQHAHAEAADADAIRANKEVESAQNQVSQETLKLQRSVEQLKAAQEVSELEYEIAQSNVEAVQVRMNAGTATVRDGAGAQTEMSEKYNALEDANFELLRARIGLLRATGELESWAEQGK